LTGRRELGCSILTFVMALAGAACTGKHSSVTPQNEGGAGPQVVPNAEPSRASLIRMNDPLTASQLLNGFHDIENNAWRWTGRNFTVLLYTPPGSSQRGATLTLKFAVPEPAIQKLGTVTLTASIDGMTLLSTTYNKPGSYTFTTDVPASMLPSDSAKIDFALNNGFHVGGDARELGLVAASVGLTEK
jgi:hypothetical protein